MKIAYACNGEGFGHAARLVTFLPHLEARHQVGLFLPASIQAYVTQRVGARPLTTIPGLHFAHRGGRIDWKQTLILAARAVLGAPLTLVRLARTLKAQGYQAVISDFEPHLAWAARLAGLAVFQLNHPGIFTRVRGHTLKDWFSALGIRLLEGPWDERVLVSFFEGDVGPLLRPSLRRKPRNRGTLLINLKESYRARALEVLGRRKGLKWKVFPAPGADFDTALVNCRAVVSPAGHQVLAEALALGKPILALPQKGQPEQELNAARLAATGRGLVGSLDTFEADLTRFLDSLPDLKRPRPLPAGFRLDDGTPALVARFERFLAARVAG